MAKLSPVVESLETIRAELKIIRENLEPKTFIEFLERLQEEIDELELEVES